MAHRNLVSIHSTGMKTLFFVCFLALFFKKVKTTQISVWLSQLKLLFNNTKLAWWWEKYLSKRSQIKHTCSWRDKLIALWTLNRQAKIFLRILNYFLGRSKLFISGRTPPLSLFSLLSLLSLYAFSSLSPLSTLEIIILV